MSQLTSCRVSVACLLALACVPGCGYGEVSPVTYEYAKALYSITNRQAGDRLPDFKTKLTEAVESGEVPSNESAWLFDIVEQAEQGDWKEANRASRQMMEDQVKPAGR